MRELTAKSRDSGSRLSVFETSDFGPSSQTLNLQAVNAIQNKLEEAVLGHRVWVKEWPPADGGHLVLHAMGETFPRCRLPCFVKCFCLGLVAIWVDLSPLDASSAARCFAVTVSG